MRTITCDLEVGTCWTQLTVFTLSAFHIRLFNYVEQAHDRVQKCSKVKGEPIIREHSLSIRPIIGSKLIPDQAYMLVCVLFSPPDVCGQAVDSNTDPAGGKHSFGFNLRPSCVPNSDDRSHYRARCINRAERGGEVRDRDSAVLPSLKVEASTE